MQEVFTVKLKQMLQFHSKYLKTLLEGFYSTLSREGRLYIYNQGATISSDTDYRE